MRSKLAGAAKKIAGKIRKESPKQEDLVLGAEAIPNGCRFDTTTRKGVATPQKNRPW